MNVIWSEDNVKVQGIHMDSSGELYFEKRVGRAYDTVHVNKDSAYSLSRYYCKSKSFPVLRQVIVCITSVQKKSRTEHCCVVYPLDSELKDKDISVLLHGNASNRTHTYIRMSRQTMEKLRDS